MEVEGGKRGGSRAGVRGRKRGGAGGVRGMSDRCGALDVALRAWMPRRLAEQRTAGERGAGSSVRAIAAATVVVAVVIVVVCAADRLRTPMD